ncbi:hypothetical protein MRX96_008916 [Rhipicephalus microplus]
MGDANRALRGQCVQMRHRNAGRCRRRFGAHTRLAPTDEDRLASSCGTREQRRSPRYGKTEMEHPDASQSLSRCQSKKKKKGALAPSRRTVRKPGECDMGHQWSYAAWLLALLLVEKTNRIRARSQAGRKT